MCSLAIECVLQGVVEGVAEGVVEGRRIPRQCAEHHLGFRV